MPSEIKSNIMRLQLESVPTVHIPSMLQPIFAACLQFDESLRVTTKQLISIIDSVIAQMPASFTPFTPTPKFGQKIAPSSDFFVVSDKVKSRYSMGVPDTKEDLFNQESVSYYTNAALQMRTGAGESMDEVEMLNSRS